MVNLYEIVDEDSVNEEDSETNEGVSEDTHAKTDEGTVIESGWRLSEENNQVEYVGPRVTFDDVKGIQKTVGALGRLTIPDLGVLKVMSSDFDNSKPGELSEAMEWDNVLFEEMDMKDDSKKVFKDRSSTGFAVLGVLDEEVLNALKIENRATNAGRLFFTQRIIEMVRRNYSYEIAWWRSQHALVRLWGQLDCAVQVFSDRQMYSDLIEVLGEDEALSQRFHTLKEDGKIFNFTSVVDNVGEIKQRILGKYRGHRKLLELIIKQSK